MSTPKTSYLVNIARGYVLTYEKSGRPSGVVVENLGDHDDEQKWIVEQGDEPDILAFKNAANGEYLYCTEARYLGKVKTGEKQWWKISYDEVKAPGACRLSVVGTPDVFLNNADMNVRRPGAGNNEVYMRKWDYTFAFQMSWYFVDANTSTSFAPGNPSSQTNDSAEETSAKVKALEDREAALAESESRYSESQKALENREAELAQNEKDYSSDKKALANRESSLAQREKEYSSKEKASADRESALAQKQKDYSSKEKALADREAALSQKEKDHSAEWDKKMKELRALQKSSAQRGKSGPGSVAGPPDCGYKHYKPPRKINRKVIGLVYEK